MSKVTEVQTKRFRLKPVTPEMVSDNWVRWTSDPVLMSQMNARIVKLSRADLQRYVVAAWQNKKMIIGIYGREGDHIGLYEATVDPRNANVTFDVLVDQQRFSLTNVLAETDPAMQDFFAKEHSIEKAIAQVVETNVPLIRHYEVTGWVKEGILRQEVQAAAGNRRLDVVQFGRLLANKQTASTA